MMRRNHILLTSLLLAIGLSGSRGEIVLRAKPAPTNAPAFAVPEPGVAQVRYADRLAFLNGDVLHGTFVSIDSRRGVRWVHPAIKQPLEITLDSLSRIELDRREPTNAAPRPRTSCVVELANGDELHGRLLGLDEQGLKLDTWYAGLLTIPREHLRVISPSATNVLVIYEGPKSMEGWSAARRGLVQIIQNGGLVPQDNSGPTAWEYRDGAFVSLSAGTLARKFEFPDKVNIEFDVAWRGYLQLAVSVFGDSLEAYGGNAYLFQFNQGSVYVQRMSRTGGSRGFGSVEIPDMIRKTSAHISIRADRQQKYLALVVDGALVKQWNDPAEFHSGPALVFYQQGRGTVRLSNIRITEWDGRFGSPEDTEQARTEDLVVMLNRDKLSGKLKDIRNGKARFATEFATLEVPLEKVSQIELAQAAKPPEPQPDWVRLQFAERGTVTLQIERWDAREIVGHSPLLGTVRLNPSAFVAMDFNLGKTRAPAGLGLGGGGEDEVIVDGLIEP